MVEIRKVLCALLFLIFLCSQNVFAQNLVTSNWLTYRNQEYKFRFIYPSDWIIKQGRGPNVKALVSNNQANNANCNVVVKTEDALAFLDDKLFLDMNENDIKEMAPEGFTYLSGGHTHVDNKNAVYMYVSGEYKAFDVSVSMKQIMVSTLVEGKMYLLTCGAVADSFQEYEPLLKQIIRSWVFEYYQ